MAPELWELAPFPVTRAGEEVFGRTSVVIINIFLKAFDSGRKSEQNKLNETEIPVIMLVFNLDQYKQIWRNTNKINLL